MTAHLFDQFPSLTAETCRPGVLLAYLEEEDEDRFLLGLALVTGECCELGGEWQAPAIWVWFDEVDTCGKIFFEDDGSFSAGQARFRVIHPAPL